ncbi:MAG TPA: S8 family serine peptidase [Thermoanaerobaculia bacterium]
MRRTLLLLLIVLSAGNTFAARKTEAERIGRSRHYIVSPATPLSASEQATMEARGIEFTAPLTNGRYLVRVAPGVAVDASFERLTAQKKVHARALRQAASGKSFVDVSVIFHDGVEFDAAREIITAKGGSFADPLQVGYQVLNRIGARIPSGALMALAADERVLLINHRRKLRAESHNLATQRLHQVDIIQAPPYGLTGSGVVLSFFEFAPAFQHLEFQGRLTTHLEGTSSGDIEHATHVAGTMIAAGIGEGVLAASAEGMAPAARLHQFSARDDDFLSLKQRLRQDYGVVADNNSWGYVLGWCTAPSCEGWVWDDTEEYYGYYDSELTAPIDKITRDNGILFVHSAGNDAEKRGPLAAPFAHKHTDDEGDLMTGTFCYSQNGSGTDCPATSAAGAPLCSSGTQFCETVRHPQTIAELPAPYGSVGLTAAAKNSIAVGAIDSSRGLAGFSSHGPARDGRVKPDLVARGVSVYSTRADNGYTSKQGTSMASPAVAGIAALITEQWRRTFSGADPKPAALKTILVAGAEEIGNPGPDYQHGFGMVNAKNSADIIIADGGLGRRVKISSLANGGTFEAPFTLTGTQNVRVVLGWSDPEVFLLASDPVDTATLVNDLDVKVITPSGSEVFPYVLNRTQPQQAATRGVNTIDNTEVIEIANAGAGTYRVVVTGTRITARSPQEFVLVTNGDMEATEPCIEVSEPNGNEGQAVTLLSGTQTAGATCVAGDNDFYKFTVSKAGTISVMVTATGTPLRVTLYGAAALLSVDIGTDQTRTLTATHGSDVPGQYFLRVETAGAIGPLAGYYVTATYPFDPGPRRRAVRR